MLLLILFVASVMLIGSVLVYFFPKMVPAAALFCLVTKGKTKSCGMTVGGLDELYIGNWDDLDPTFGSTASNFAVDGSITNLALKENKKIYKYDFENNSAGFTQELQVGANRYVNVQINMQFAGIDQATTNLANVLAVGKVFVIARLRGSGKYIALGVPNKEGKGTYLQSTALTANSGQAEGDLEGYTSTIGGPQTFYANQIDRVAFATKIDTAA